ncbi:hypothetical protein KKC62_02880 [Patescibacteria group bacterium]|nr:hypothetical protein [Patescibacteria group bacterium]MBU1953127.1 hypothetical protein [Patescibacteria group bacterium]
MNLTRVSAMLKKASKWVFLVIGAYYIAILLIIPGGQSAIRALFTKKEPPVITYGLLDQLEFVEKRIGKTAPEYVLNTKNGKLPTNLPMQLPVYKFKPIQYSYLAGKNAISDAARLGFGDKDLSSDLKGKTYVWRNSLTKSTLSIDLETRKLTLITDFSGSGNSYAPGNISIQKAPILASQILLAIYRFDDSYAKGTQNIILGSFQGNKIYETTDVREAQLARIDYYRTIDNYPIFGPDPSEGLLRVSVGNTPQGVSPLNNPMMGVNYWEIIPQTDSKYPIIPVSEAWAAVKSGKGIISRVFQRGLNPFESYVPLEVEKILIDNIYLGYYETPKYQTYLQPIYIFSGTYTTRGSPGGDITIYFPAVSGQYTKQNATNTTPSK